MKHGCINEGHIVKCHMLKEMKITVGKNTVNALKSVDEARVRFVQRQAEERKARPEGRRKEKLRQWENLQLQMTQAIVLHYFHGRF